MKKWSLSFLFILSLFAYASILYSPRTLYAADNTTTQTPSSTGGCTYYDFNNKPHQNAGRSGGILVPCLPTGADDNFKTYLSELLRQNTIYVLAVAVIIIIASGIEYMAALGSSSAQTKAKQRILGVISGIILFTLIRAIVKLLANDISL